MKKLIQYIGATLIVALPGLGLLNENSEEPKLKPSANLNAMVWSYAGELESRNFKDVKPFGSLDEVVLRENRKVITLKPGDKSFDEQKKIYKEKVVPYFKR